MYAQLEEVRNLGRKFKKQVKESVGVKHIAGTHEASSEGTTHSVKDHEVNGFADWINKWVTFCQKLKVICVYGNRLVFVNHYDCYLDQELLLLLLPRCIIPMIWLLKWSLPLA